MEDTNLSSLASSGHHRTYENENKLGGEFEGNQTPDEEFETKGPASESLLEQASGDSSEECKTAKEIISNGLHVHRLSGVLQHVRCTPSTCTSMKAKKTSGSFTIANVFLGILSPEFILQLSTLVVVMLLLLAGDVERNPGPVTKLNNNNYPDICKYIKVMDTKQLQHLGTELGLDFSNVEKMKDLPAQMVGAWLRAEDNVGKRSGPPSWESLIKALRTIGQTGIANKIDSEKVKIQVNYPTSTPFPKQSSNSSDLSNDSGGSDSPPDDDGAVTLSSKPSIRELRQLPVTNLWYNLGLQLKVSQEELDKIQSKYRDEKLCRTKMFGVWRREDDRPSYEKLLQALAAVGRRDLVESICKQKGTSFGSFLPNSPHDPAIYQPQFTNTSPQDLESQYPMNSVGPNVEARDTALKSQFDNVGLGAGAEQVKFQLHQRASSQTIHKPIVSPAPLPECIKEYAEFLKSKYRHALPLMPPGEWPPNRGRQYSDLTIVEKVSDFLPDQESVDERSKAINQGKVKVPENERVIKSLDDVLAQDSITSLKVLVEGVPGVGKSTLVRKSCKDWADGKSLQQFDLVLLVTLRRQNIRQAKVVEELLEADDPDLKKEVAKHLQKTSGEGVLFLFDGYDELNKEEQSFFQNLIQGELLHKCSIILTSRSYAVQDLKYEEWIHRHVEILGFTEQQMASYFLQNSTSTLVQSLKEDASLSSISYTPLNCSILLYIFQQGKFKLPNTLTELYEIFVLSLINRHLRRVNSFRKALPKNLSSLPQPICTQFSALCKLAYDGLEKGKFKFSSQDITEGYQGSCEGDMEANLLSLMTSTTSFSSFGEESHYQFLHTTVQEFLAARWIASQPEDVQKRFLATSWRLPKMRFRLVFYAGITKLRGQLFGEVLADVKGYFCSNAILQYGHLDSGIEPPENHYLHVQRGAVSVQHCIAVPKYPIYSQGAASVQPLCVKPSNQLIKEPANVSAATEAFLNIVSMIHEAQNDSLYNLVFHQARDKLSIQNYPPLKKRKLNVESDLCGVNVGHCKLTGQECSAIANFLAKCPNPLKSIQFNFCNLTNNSIEILHKVSTNGNCTLKECVKNQFNYCAPSFSLALSLLPLIPWFQQTKVLHLQGLQYPKGLNPDKFHLSSLLYMRNLEELSVTVEQIPKEHLHDHETVFLKFVEVLRTNNTLRRFSYDQSPSAATCESFVQLMSALSYNTRVSLNIGNTNILKVHKADRSTPVTIPERICFKVCSRGLAAVMELANAQGINRLEVNQPSAHISCKSCQTTLIEPKTAPTGCKDICYSLPQSDEMSIVDISRSPVESEDQPRSKAFAGFGLSEITRSQTIRVLHLHGLHYPRGLLPDKFHLFSLHYMRNLEELSVTVKKIPKEHLHDYETVFLKFVKALRTNNTLRRFSYNQSPSAATCESFVQLMSALSHNTRVSLKIGNTDVITVHSVTIPEGICFKVCSRGLTAAMELVDARGIKKLHVNQKSVSLQCKSCQFIVESKQVIADSKSYPPILSKSQVSLESEDSVVLMLIITAMAKNKTLESINFSGRQVTDEIAQCIAAGLAENRTLKEIKLNPSHLTSKGMGYILKSVNPNKSVDKLDIQCRVADCGVRNFVVNSSPSPSSSDMADITADNFSTVVLLLDYLTSKQATIKMVIEALFDMMESVHMSTSSEEVFEGISEEMLRNSQVMRTLDLSFCKLDDEDATHIATGLTKNHSLKMLNLRYNSITSTGAVEIFKSLENNNNLEKLVLWSNNFHKSVIRPTVAGESMGCAVEKMLSVNQTLRTLDLCHCELDDEDATHIATGLTKNHSLKILNLSCNNITSTGAVEIFKSLESNTSLEELDLSGNNLSSEGDDESLKFIVNILTANQTLRKVGLRYCRLGHSLVTTLKSITILWVVV